MNLYNSLIRDYMMSKGVFEFESNRSDEYGGGR